MLVKTKPNDFVDVQGMTKRSCLLVWVIYFPFLFIYNLVIYAPIVIASWPNIPDLRKIEHGVLTGAMVASTFAYNLPDFFSLAIYMKMSIHFKKKNNIVQPVSEIQMESVELHGAVMDVLNNHEMPNLPTQNEHKDARRIMAKLVVHLSVTMLDLAVSLVNAFLVYSLAGRILMKLYMVVFCFWLPLLVIKANVKELEDMVPYLNRLMRCRQENDN